MTIALMGLYTSLKAHVDHGGTESGNLTINQGLTPAIEGRSGTAPVVEQQAATDRLSSPGVTQITDEARQQTNTGTIHEEQGQGQGGHKAGSTMQQQEDQGLPSQQSKSVSDAEGSARAAGQQPGADSKQQGSSSSTTTTSISPQHCSELNREFLAAHAVHNTIVMAACDWHMFEVRPFQRSAHGVGQQHARCLLPPPVLVHTQRHWACISQHASMLHVGVHMPQQAPAAPHRMPHTLTCHLPPQEFGPTWLHHIQKVHKGHVVVAATDERTVTHLAGRPGVACVRNFYKKVSVQAG
jgi:hypothetical protein